MSPTAAAAATPSDARRADGRVRADHDFEAAFHAHYDRLVRTLTVIAGNRESAADAVQEAFVKAHLRWGRIGRYDDPIGWVRRVAINRLRDDHRSQQRRRRLLPRLASEVETTVPAHDIDEFDRLLATLPRRQRAATALFYVDGLSVAEIAEALGVSAGTVKSNLHDARTRLRAVLAREHRTDGSHEEADR